MGQSQGTGKGQQALRFLLCVIGMVLIIEGLPYFAFPEKIKAYLLKVCDTPEPVLRILGLAAVIMGLALVYMGRS